jgi:hypothetical protein
MTVGDFRRIALGMDGAIESAHMGHPDFRANGTIFATIHDHKSGMVKLTPEHQQKFMRENPEAFTPESGAWGRAGCTRMQFDAVDEEAAGEATTLAWRKAIEAKPRTKRNQSRL